MAANESTFTIFLKTIADATGLTNIGNAAQTQVSKIEEINQRLQRGASLVNQALGAIGLGLTIRQLNEYGNKALEASQQQALWNIQILGGVDGSQQLVDELNNLNEELDRTTGTNQEVSRSMQKNLSMFGATGDQLKALTKGIIDFAATRGQKPADMAFLLSRALAGEDLALTRLGIHLDKTKSHAAQVDDLIAQVGKFSGTAEALAKASGGMTELESATRDAQLALGNLVNTVRIPFLTAFTGQLTDAKGKMDSLAKSGIDAGNVADTWGFKFAVAARLVGHTISNILNVISALYNGLRAMQAFFSALVIAAATATVLGVEKLVHGAIDQLSSLAKFAADTARVLSLGAINIDTAGFDASATSLKGKVGALAGDVKKAFSGMIDPVDKEFQDAIKRFEDSVVNMSKGGARVFDKEFYEKVKAQYLSLFSSIKNTALNVAPGSRVIEGGGGADSANAAKAATDALSNAKFRLAAAQQAYQQALEETKLLEESGAISADEANNRRQQSTRDFIAGLENLQRALPPLISQLEKVGNVQGANELKHALGEIRIEVLKVKGAAANLTFFGQMRAQLLQLSSEWGNLGKQIGGFLTQQFQNLAATGGQVISGLIFRTGNWKQSILQLGQSFVQMLAQMVIQWVLSRTIMSALNKAFGVADATAATGQAGVAAAAWSPAAVSASIATFGSAAGLGLTAYLTALASGTAGAVAASGVGFFQSGGYTGERGGIVHPREFVFSAPRVSALGRGFLEALHNGALNVTRPSFSPLGVSSGSGGGGGIDPNDLKVEVYNFTDMRKLQERWARSAAGRKILNGHNRRNRL